MICGALRDLVPFVQLKNCEKYPWRRVNFSKAVGFTLIHGCLSHFLNCANRTKLRKVPHIVFSSLILSMTKLPLLQNRTMQELSHLGIF